MADAFNVAFRFPNLFRRLFGEGAFNSAFIPLFAKELETNGREQARVFAEEAMSGLVLVLAVLTIVAMITMPWLMYLLAPGFSADPQKFDLAVLLTQITFPYLLLHVAGGAVFGRAQHVRQVRRKLGRSRSC